MNDNYLTTTEILTRAQLQNGRAAQPNELGSAVFEPANCGGWASVSTAISIPYLFYSQKYREVLLYLCNLLELLLYIFAQNTQSREQESRRGGNSASQWGDIGLLLLPDLTAET